MNAGRTIPKIATKRANTERPAININQFSYQYQREKVIKRTRSNIPFRLKTCNAGETAHGNEAEEYLTSMSYDGWFRHDHLQETKMSV